MTDKVEQLYQVLAHIDALADEAAGLIKPQPEDKAHIPVDLALERLRSTWGGKNNPEFAARSRWLRSEVLRRLPKVGLA